VDAVSVQVETIHTILAAADREPNAIWRPVHRGAKGNLLWIPRVAGLQLMQLRPDARVDEWVQPLARSLEVDDPAILRNVNTPEEWAKIGV
jgi:CTP:molybdopterin cytidylyltransferase MocA